jgi:hypothetical protein
MLQSGGERGKLQGKSLQLAFTCAGAVIELHLLKCQCPKEIKKLRNEKERRKRKEKQRRGKKRKEKERKGKKRRERKKERKGEKRKAKERTGKSRK